MTSVARIRALFSCTAFLVCTLFVLSTAAAPSVIATHGMVASVDSVATEAGLKVLQQGGNAVDAAVAVGLTLGVVNTQNSGLGGGCFMLIHLANGTNVCLDGREMAPLRRHARHVRS